MSDKSEAMRPLDDFIKRRLDRYLVTIGEIANAEAIALVGPIIGGLERALRDALEAIPNREEQKSIVVILDTPGGIVEVVQRMVTTNTLPLQRHDSNRA